MIQNSLSRRKGLLAAAGLPFALAAAAVADAGAAEMRPTEKANLEAALAFIKLWGEQTTDAAKLASYFTDDCIVLTEEAKPATHGKAEAERLFAGYMARMRIDMKVFSSYAFGPVVLIGKEDAVIRDGKAGKYNPFAGLFVFRDGKIKEWYEYAAKG